MIYSYIDKAEVIKKFTRKNDADIHIQNIGYHNFDYIKPIMWVHRQFGYTIHYVISGSGTLILNGKEHKIHKKQLFFIPPNQDQVYYPDPEDKWKYIWIYFSGNFANQLGEDMGFSIEEPVRSPKDHRTVEKAMMNMIASADEGKINEYMAKSAFYTVAGALSPESAPENLAKGCALEAEQFLSSNFTNCDLSIKDLCDILYVSHSSLCKEFKNEYDVTPLKYLIQLRMNHAAKLLRESPLSIKEVAARSGYGDEIHFIKTFKSYYGDTASKYRQNMQKKKEKRA